MNQRKLDREKLLFQYTNALEHGDFTTVEAILRQAQHDAELERMIAEINKALTQELPSVTSNHRYNHKDSTMYANPTLPRTAKLQEMPHQRRFPYALAAAILAVVLVGGLLLTAKFGFDNQGDNAGGASLQRESATPIASATPSPLNPIQANATPTMFVNPADPAGNTATPLATVLPSSNAFFVGDPICTGIVELSSNSPTAILVSRPGATRVIVGYVNNQEYVEIVDQALWPGGVGVWSDTPPGLFYFVRANHAGYNQGWLFSSLVSLTSECPPLPPYEAEYWMSGSAISSVEGGPVTPIVEGNLAPTTPPLNPASQPQDDTDGDGLTNADELALGTNPNVWDTDGDDVGDGSEIRAGTDPLNPDTDMDGVVDSQDTSPIIPNDPEATIAAILQTATAHAPTATPSVTPSAIFSPTPTVCNPTAPSRLSKGDQGRIIGEGRTGVNLRQNYGFDAPLIRLLDVDTEFEVIDLNAICVQDTNWYKIAIDGEAAGWIPETMWVIEDGAASNVYVIEPIE